MESLTSIFSRTRNDLSLKMREVSAQTGIDQALLSKIERGVRLPTIDQLHAISSVYKLDFTELKKYWLAEKVLQQVKAYPEVAAAAMIIAEPRVEYLASTQVLDTITLSPVVEEKLAHIDKLKEKWQALRPLDKGQLDKMHEYYAINYTAESNQIEGNTLSVKETELVINKGITITGKTVNEHLEAINHGHAVE